RGSPLCRGQEPNALRPDRRCYAPTTLDDSCSLKVGERFLVVADFAKDLFAVLAQKRGPLDGDRRVRELQRTADRLERASFGVRDVENHAADERFVFDEVLGAHDRPARNVDLVELVEDLE